MSRTSLLPPPSDDASAAAASADLEPLLPQGLEDLLRDFFRLYDPDRLPEVPALLLRGDDGGAGPGRKRRRPAAVEDGDTAAAASSSSSAPSPAALLVSELESAYGVPGALSPSLCRFNLGSRFFAPLPALYDRHLVPPVPHVRPLDNVHKAQLLVPKRAPSSLVKIGVLHSDETGQRDSRWREGEVVGLGCFLSALLPTLTTHTPARASSRPPSPPRSAGTLHTTLFDWLAEAAGGSGQAVDNPSASPPSPMAALHALYRDRARVCVTVADGAGAGDGSVRMPHVRRIVGTLRGFDEAWTLVLLDAEEEEEEEEVEEGKGGGGAAMAATRARHSRRKHAQLLVMGDTVVSVGRRVS